MAAQSLHLQLSLTLSDRRKEEYDGVQGTQQGVIISLVIAGCLAFQHFSRAESLRKAFEQGLVVATLAIICITASGFISHL